MNLENGRVKWFNEKKGFGFIARDDAKDLFVQFRSIAGDGFTTLNGGQGVKFEVQDGSKGPQAVNVMPL